MTVGQYRHGVLDTDTPVTGKVDPGLDGDHVAVGQCTRGRRGHRRGFVHVQSDPVAEGVTEVRAVSGFGDDPPADGVQRGAVHPGPDRRDTGELGTQRDLVDLV